MKISSLQLCAGGWELKLHLYPQMRLSYKHYISSIAMPLYIAAISDCVLSLLIQSSINAKSVVKSRAITLLQSRSALFSNRSKVKFSGVLLTGFYSIMS